MSLTLTAPAFIDARGARFSAAITTLVLAMALALSSPYLLLFQAAVFAIGSSVGPHQSPYGVIFRNLVQPRLRGSVEREAVEPARFAQRVGLIFALTGLLGALLGVPAIFLAATAAALAAAFLNAAFGFCLGCQMFLILVRAGVIRTPAPSSVGFARR
jgi:hypothetical protein